MLFAVNHVRFCQVLLAFVTKPLTLYSFPNSFFLPYQVVLKGKQKVLVTGILTVALLLLTAGSTVFMILGVSSTLVVSHAVFHKVMNDGDDDDVQEGLIAASDNV
jgi:hypothetical protein